MNALILFARIEAGRQTCQILMENSGIGFDDGTEKHTDGGAHFGLTITID